MAAVAAAGAALHDADLFGEPLRVVGAGGRFMLYGLAVC